MSELIRYEQARLALASASSVDEVKNIRDKAQAMAAYAKQAKDTELIQYATEIKVRAERRCGEMLRETAKTGTRNTGGKPSHDATVSTLAQIGLTKDQSSRYQQLAEIPAAQFETVVATAKESVGQVTSAMLLRKAKELRGPAVESKKAKPAAPASKEPLWPAAKPFKPEVDRRDRDPEPFNPDDGAPSLEELAATDKLIEQEQEAFRQMLEADDKLAQAAAMLKQRNALVEQLQWRINGLVNENGELVRDVKYWRSRALKAERVAA